MLIAKRENNESGCFRQVRQLLVAAMTLQFLVAGIDGVDLSREAATFEIDQRPLTQRILARRSADHGNGLRTQERVKPMFH